MEDDFSENGGVEDDSLDKDGWIRQRWTDWIAKRQTHPSDLIENRQHRNINVFLLGLRHEICTTQNRCNLRGT